MKFNMSVAEEFVHTLSLLPYPNYRFIQNGVEKSGV